MTKTVRARQDSTLWLKTSLVVYLGTQLGLVAMLVGSAMPWLLRPGGWGEMIGQHWDPLAGYFGLLPFVEGTVVVTGISLLVAGPLAMAVAVVGSQILRAKPQLFLSQGLSIMAAIPSVLYGWWGLTLMVPLVRMISHGPGFSLLAAGLVLALMVLPTMAVLFQDALRQVPATCYAGSLALGATADQTLVRLIWPASRFLLIRAVLTAVARSLGETMAVQMVIGGQTAFHLNLLGPGATLTTQILTDLSIFPPGTEGYQALAVMALLLIGAMVVIVRVGSRWERAS